MIRPNKQKNRHQDEPRIINTIVLPFAAYLFTFVGMGLVSGSVVHMGETAQIPRFMTIGGVGIGMFTLSSYIQETRLKSSTMRSWEIVRYVFYSLILAVGIGMISGGTQHFLDFPTYASYLLPVGFVLALIAYIVRNGFSLTRRGWSILISGALLLALPTFMGLNHYAQALPVGSGHHHEEEQPIAGASDTETVPHDVAVAINDVAINSDDDAISQMIAHHQETIDLAKRVQSVTQNSSLKAIATSVILTRNQDIAELQHWLKHESGAHSESKAHDNSDGHTH